MKQIFIAMLLAAFIWPAMNASGQIIISQYIDTNSGTAPKGIELWNTSGSTIDFSATNLDILKGANGGTPASDILISSGTLADGEVIVVGTSDLNPDYEKSFSFNGDDALEIQLDGTTVDVFGTPGSDPGSAWTGNGVSTADQNIQLKAGITTGDTDGWTDPSIRFETVSTDPLNDQSGFGIAPGSTDPVIEVTPASLSGFGYSPGNGPSAEQTFDISGTNLTEALTITAPTNYEMSLMSGGAFASSATLTPDGSGSVSSTIYVRLKAGLTEGDYNNENITATSSGATEKTVTCSGSVIDMPDLIISEVADPGDEYTGRFVELYNVGTTTIDFNNTIVYAAIQFNGGNFSSTQLTGTLAPGETYTIANASNFTGFYGFSPDIDHGSFDGNGDDGYFLYVGGDETSGTLFDAYGVVDVDGTGEAWEYEDSRAVRSSSVTSPNATWTATEWTITAEANVADMTANAHEDHTTFSGMTDADWNTVGNWSGGALPTATSVITIPTGKAVSIAAGKETADCHDLTMEPTSTITINGTLNVGNDLMLMSDATGTASLIDNGTLNVTGNSSAQLYMAENPTDADNWHYVSIPVGSATSAVFDPASGDNDLYYWVEANDNYTEITDNATALDVGEGYAVNQTAARTVNITGTFNTGDFMSSSLSNTTASNKNGYHLIGNPYPSAIDMQAAGWSPTNLTQDAWFRFDGQFGTYNWETGDTQNGGTQTIPAMQAVWVKVADGQTSGSVDLTNEARVHSTANVFKETSNNVFRLEAAREGYTDEAVIGIYDNAEVGFENTDSKKMFASSDKYPQIYTFSDNKEVAINGLPASYCANLEMPLGFQTEYAGEFTLNATNISEFDAQFNVFLKDNQTGELTDMRSKGTYTFTSEVVNTSDRFEIIISNSANDIETIENGMNIYTANNQVIVNTNETIQGTMTIFDISGKAVMSEHVNISGSKTFELNQPKGVYMINIKSDNKNVTEKIVIR